MLKYYPFLHFAMQRILIDLDYPTINLITTRLIHNRKELTVTTFL